MKKFKLRLIIKEEIEKIIGRGGSKEVTSTDNSNIVTKKFLGNINKENLLKEKQLGDKYPNFIAKTIKLTDNSLTQEKLNNNKLYSQIILSLSEEGQELFEESGLDDEFEFLVKYPHYNKNKELKDKISKLDNFVKNTLINKEKISINDLDYPNMNNIGYDNKGNIKLLEIFY